MEKIKIYRYLRKLEELRRILDRLSGHHEGRDYHRNFDKPLASAQPS